MIFTEIFDNLQSFSNTINKRVVNETFTTHAEILVSQVEGRSEKLGTASFSEAEKLLLSGDNANLNKLKSVNVKSLSHSNEYTKNMLKIEKNVCGCLPNIPLYLIGTPNNMLNFKRSKVKNKVLNLVVNAGVTYDVECEQIIEAGANIASIIKKLERNNIRVNLYVSFFTKTRGNDYLGVLINIKKSSAPLNMLNISYPLINPSMLRRHFLRYVETVPAKIDKSIVKTYGQPVMFNDMLKLEPKLNRFKDSVIINIQEMINVSVSDMVKTISDKTK